LKLKPLDIICKTDIVRFFRFFSSSELRNIQIISAKRFPRLVELILDDKYDIGTRFGLL